jgi:hypothetical protein
MDQVRCILFDIPDHVLRAGTLRFRQQDHGDISRRTARRNTQTACKN